MRKKKIYLLIGALLSSVVILTGCTNSNVNEIKEKGEEIAGSVEDGIEKGKTAIENGVDKVAKDAEWFTAIDFTDMAYSEDSLDIDLKNNGHTPKTSNEVKDNLFTVEREDITISLGTLSVYEYDSDEKENMVADVRKITENGKIINGEVIKWSSTPHFYKKGRIIVIYDGNNSEMINLLNTILGDAFIK